MNKSTNVKSMIAALVLPLMLTGCFSSSPTRSGQGDESPTSMPTPPTNSDSRSQRQGQGEGQSSIPGRSTTGTSNRGTLPTTPSSKPGKREHGMPSGKSGSGTEDDIRVATADSVEGDSDTRSDGTVDTANTAVAGDPDVSVAEALEGANAAVDAAAAAVNDAEATIERAREIAESGPGQTNTYDPFMEPGGKTSTEPSAAGDGGGTAADGSGDGTSETSEQQSDGDAGTDDVVETASDGNKDGEDNFDPFAVFEQSAASGQQTAQSRASSGASLEIAEDALAAARAALNRARRALITAADAGAPDSGDADADAVQLAAARAAMEAAAEAVIASAIAVIAASDAYGPAEQTDPNYNADSDDSIAAGIEMVVVIAQRDMKNASEALEATGELLAAAGALMAVLGAAPEQPEPGEADVSSGERVASLEEELDKSLAVFDDRMQTEGSSAVPGIAGEDIEMADQAGGGDPRAGTAVTERSRDGRVAARARQGENSFERPDGEWAEHNQTARRESAGDAEDGAFVVDERGPAQDDDIVARQLREAAMAETDPELQEKLWEEYRSYKESLETGEAEAAR